MYVDQANLRIEVSRELRCILQRRFCELGFPMGYDQLKSRNSGRIKCARYVVELIPDRLVFHHETQSSEKPAKKLLRRH